MFGSGTGIVNRIRALRLTGGRVVSGFIGATLFPPRCCLCGLDGTAPDLDLCPWCREALPWDRASDDGTVAALRFEPPADRLIRELKYQGVTAHARVLGRLLADVVRARGDPLPTLIVPVPLHRVRFRERGFNQALTLARHVGRELNVHVAGDVLKRVRDTPSQTGLDRERRIENVRGAFAVGSADAARLLRAAGHVAVIDDVFTTGSTLGEVRRVLLAAGVSRVDAWTVARAGP